MKKLYYIYSKRKSFFDQSKIILFLMMVVLLFFPNYSKGQVTLFQFDFENNTTPNIDNVIGVPAFSSNGLGTVGYTTTNPCQGSRMLTGDNWNTGDYYRFTVNTTGFANMTFSFCNRTDATTIGTFIVRVSADGGGSWATVLTTYTPSTSNNTLVTTTFPTVANNDAAVWIEIYKTNNANSNNRDYIIDAATLIGHRIPTITSFTPTNGCTGSNVVITGTNFTGATAVNFNGTPATSFTVDSATQITATIPSGATTGVITVTTSGGTATSPSSLTVNQPSVAPTGISGTTTICNGSSTTLTAVGGTLGTGANYQWGTGSVVGTNPIIGQTTSSLTISPIVTTSYWVRIQNTASPCTAATTGIVQSVTVNQPSVAPTGISGTTTICAGNSTTLTVSGGTAGTGATAEWFTGSCGGTAVGTGNSITVSPSTTTDYFVRYSGTCNTTTCASTTITVNTPSVNPTSISGTSTICNGSSTTLTAVGGTLGTGANYQWGTGSVVGTNPIIGQTTSSLTISPIVTTSYWVRIQNTASPCTAATTGIVQSVTVNQPSVAPTGISGTTTICNGNSTTLTLVGGTAGTGATAEWFTGSCGGTAVGTGNSITVSPSTTTDYFVRYSGTCNTTTCASTTITVNTPSVNPTSISGTSTICNGSSTTLTAVGGTLGTGANYQWGTDSVVGTNPIIGQTTSSLTISPIVTTSYWVRIQNTASPCTAKTTGIVQSVTVNQPSVAPTGISGITTICSGNATTLTVSGGTAGTGAIAEWFIGSCAGTPAGTGNSITVSPSTTTDYFVRYSGTCNTTTCASVTVTVNSLPANPANPTSDSPQCSPIDVTITQTGSAPIGETWYWQTIPLGTSTVNSNSTYNASSTGTYYLRSQNNSTGCWSIGSASISVVINLLPIITYTTDLCVGTDHQFSPDIDGTWISNNPSIATITASGYMIGISAGIVTFTFTDSNTGCSITTGNVNVYDLPIVSAPTEVCVGETIALSPSSAGTWISNDTAIATVDLFTGIVTSVAEGSTTFTYTEFSPGCSATTNAVNVKALPVLGGPNSVCIGDTIQLTPNSGGTWISNDTNVATIDNTGLVTGVNSGNTTFTFTDATSGCSKTTNTINIYSYSIAPTNILGVTTICEGTSTTLTVDGGFIGSGGIVEWFSDSCGGTLIGTGNSITVSPIINTTYYVRYSGNCNTTSCASVLITVDPLPLAAGTISGLATVCQAQNGVVYTVPPIANATSYVWTLPTGATIVSGVGTNSITVDYDLSATSGNITVLGSNACGNGVISTNYPVTVNITPSILTNYEPIICSTETITVSPTNGGGNIVPVGTVYSWGLPVISGGITGATAEVGQTSFIQSLTNTTNIPQTASYDVTASTGGCSDSTFSVLVTVNPQPTISGDILAQTICSGSAIAPISFTNPNNISGTIEYNWTRDNTANITGIGSSGTGSTISGSLLNTTNIQQTTIFTVIATTEDNCNSLPFTVSVSVDPMPTIAASPITQTVCSDNPITDINISNPNVVIGTTYSWTRTNTVNLTGIANGSGTTISGTLTNITNIPQTTVFTITASANGCNLNSTTVSVTVNPKPTVAVSLVSQDVCGGSPITNITISNPNLVSGTTYSWNRDNIVSLTGIASNGISSTISGTFVNNTNSDQLAVFTVTAHAGTCNSTSTTSTVNVKPTPTIGISTISQTKCNATPITNINITNPNNVAGTTYTWTRNKTVELTGIPASGSSNVAFSISGTLTNTTNINQTVTFTIVATAANGCSKTSTATVTVYAPLVAPVISAAQTVCVLSTPAALTSTLPSGGSGIYTYQWQSSSSSTGPFANITGATSLNYQPPFVNLGANDVYYRLIVNNTCGQVISNTIFVEVVSNVGFSFNVNNGFTGSLCPGSTFTPSISSVHLSTSAVRYDWAADSNYILPSTGGPVGTTGNVIIIVRTSSANIGPLTTQNNTNATVTTQVSITPSVYNFPGPPSGSFICSVSPQLINVTIYPKPIVTPVVANTTICSGTSAGIVLSGNITDIGNTTTFNWSVNDNPNITGDNTSSSGSISVGGTFTINNVLTNTSTTTQDVTYTITPISNGCSGNPVTLTITVAPAVTPGTVTANQTICSGGDPNAFTETIAATGQNLSYQWQSSLDNTSYTDILGATSSTYDAPSGPTATTWYRRVVTSTVNGVACSNATGTPIQISVNSINPGSITGTQTVCSTDDPTAFTSIAATGTGTISYQWQSNISGCAGTWVDIIGATNATYDIPALALTVTTYFRRVAISTLNSVSCIDYSNCIIVYINNITSGVIGNDQTVCNINNPAAFTTITPATGNGTLSYQWQSNTSSCTGSWVNISGATSATYDAPSLATTTYYRRLVTSTLNGYQCTAISNCVIVTVNFVTAGTISGNTTICSGGNPAPFSQATAATGNSLTYQWQSGPASGGPWTDITGATGVTYDAPGPITVKTFYRRVVYSTINSVTCSSNSASVSVTVNDVTAPIVVGNQTLCSDLDPTAFTVSSAATGSGPLTYQWQSSIVDCNNGFNNITGANLATYNPPAISQTTYYRNIVTSTLSGVTCTATSNCITVTSLAKTWNGSISNDWNTNGNWTPVGVPDNSNCVVIPNVTNDPIISGTAFAYSLNILNGGKLEVNPTNSITVTDIVNVSSGGQFFIKNSASLIQINDVPNTVFGLFSVERITQPLYRYDYTYWGSPLTLASNYSLGNLSALTQPDKFYSWIPSVSGGNGNWNQESVATIMNPNKGYIVRAPQTYSMNPLIKIPYTATFTGTPNNGTFTAPVSCGNLGSGTKNDKWNLLGNPYPSAINALDFLSTNSNIQGSIQLWTHNSVISSSNPNPFYGTFTYNYSPTDFIVYNAIGPNPPGFDGKIASGQGFMVSMLDSCVGTTTNVTFNNNMRSNTYSNAEFYKSINQNASFTDSHDKSRIWFSLVDTNNLGKTTLLGYVNGATYNNDRLFDASTYIEGSMEIYSLIGNKPMIIQGRPAPFDENDFVPLGVKISNAGNYKIAIDQLDGLFTTQNIYLEDKLLNIIHDIKQSEYSFTSETGTFNDRFVIRYTNNTLSKPKLNNLDGLVAVIYNKVITVQSSENIKSIEIFDIAGKHIKTYRIKGSYKNFNENFYFAEGIYIAKIKLENNIMQTRKLVNIN